MRTRISRLILKEFGFEPRVMVISDSVAINAWGHFENDYARRLRWRKAKHVTEIVVERDEGAALADVLVELELQAAWVVGTGPIRSRVTSAP